MFTAYYTRFAVAATIVAAGAGAEEFFVDHALFYPPPHERARLEVYFGIPLDRLGVAEDAEGAPVRVFNFGASVVRAADGEEVAERVENHVVDADETAANRFYIGQVDLMVPPGEYKLRVGMGDVVANLSFVNERDLLVASPPPDGPFLSDLELANSAAADAGADVGRFRKSGFYVFPNPTKVVDDQNPTLMVYLEFYRLPVAPGGEAAFTVAYDIAQLNGRRVLEATRTMTAAGADVGRVEVFDITGVPPGRYVLTSRLSDGPDGESAAARKEFVVYHRRGPDGVGAAAGLYAPYSQEDEKRIRKEIGLIAAKEELAAFDALPPEEKPIFVENFWERRDPDKDTPENEFKNEFYKRYALAEGKYRTPFREGVDTDRGRVYMKFGPADQVITNPMGARSETGIDYSAWASEAFEAWEYYKPGGVDSQYIFFVFVDRNGDGDYDLDSSSVPGYGKLVRSSGR